MEAAQAALEDAEAPQGIDFPDPARLDGLAGSTYLLLRDTDRAQQIRTAAVARRATSDAKGRALLTLDLAACRVLQDEGEESCRLIEEALAMVAGSMVGPILARAQAVRASVGGSAGTHALARVDARIAELPR